MLTPPSGRATITKEKFMRKFSPKRAARMHLKEPSVSKFMIDLQEMPLASEDQKELMKMQSIFNQFLEEQTRKKQNRRSQQNKSVEELTKLRAEKLDGMDINSGGTLETEERKKFNKLQSQKIFEHDQHLEKVQNVVFKTKIRINNKHLNREQKFKKNFELFKDMDSYLEVKDLLQKLNHMDGSHSGSKATSRILDSRQIRIAQVISDIENEEANNEDDLDYQQALIRDYELIAKAGRNLRRSLQFIQRSNEHLENDMMERISNELNEQLQDTNGVELEDGVYQSDRITQYINKMMKGSIDFQQNLSSKKYRKLKKNSIFSFNQNFEEESSKKIYDQFKQNSNKIMNMLVNTSKQIYNKKMAEGQEKSKFSKGKQKSKSVAEIRHEPQKKSVFFLQKSLKNLDSTEKEQFQGLMKSTSLVERNKVVNPLKKEHDELQSLKANNIKIDTNNLMDLKQRIYQQTEKLPRLKQIQQLHQNIFSTGVETPLDSMLEDRMKRSMSNAKSLLAVSHGKIKIKPKFKQLFSKVNEPISPSPATPPKKQASIAPNEIDPERSSNPQLDQSVDSTSNSHMSSPSQSSHQRYRTNRNVRKQRKEIQFLIDQIEQTKDNIVREKKTYQKRINEIETTYKHDMDRFKPEAVESLKFIKVNKSMDPIKHRLRKKKN